MTNNKWIKKKQTCINAAMAKEAKKEKRKKEANRLLEKILWKIDETKNLNDKRKNQWGKKATSNGQRK